MNFKTYSSTFKYLVELVTSLENAIEDELNIASRFIILAYP